MCRLFAFRSRSPSAVHRSLLFERNALRAQSREHPDGWGIGWWEEGFPVPLLERGAGSAFAESDFERVAKMVAASSVIAHVRKASVGRIGRSNSHPFRHGRWLFAHNGTITRFADTRAAIEAEIDPAFRRFEGETDTERCFALFLTRLAARGPLTGELAVPEVFAALAETVQTVSRLADGSGPDRSSTTFLVGNGSVLAAFRRGRTLFASTHKKLCSERSTCPRLSPQCESPASPGAHLNHFLVASEQLSTEDVWEEVPEDSFVGIDQDMTYCRASLDDPRATHLA